MIKNRRTKNRTSVEAPVKGTQEKPDPRVLLSHFLATNNLEIVQGIATEKTEGGKLIVGPVFGVQYRKTQGLPNPPAPQPVPEGQ